MFVPIIPRVNVVNKTIVYTDTVFSLKEKGEHLKTKTIYGVEEQSLNKCLTLIFESNPNVTFNTVSYSPKNESVTFYTDKNILIDAWNESIKPEKLKYLDVNKRILEELKKILQSSASNDPNLVPLSAVYDKICQKQQVVFKMKEKYRILIRNILQASHSYYTLVVHDFNYKTKELHVSFNPDFYYFKHYNIYFSKNEGDLYISQADNPFYAKLVLSLALNELSSLYDEFLKLPEFESKNRISTINSEFCVNFDKFNTEIYYSSGDPFFNKEFLFEIYYDDETKNIIDCNSGMVLNLVKEREREILKRLFIRIDDCPDFIKEELIKERLNELNPQKEKPVVRQRKRKGLFAFLKGE